MATVRFPLTEIRMARKRRPARRPGPATPAAWPFDPHHADARPAAVDLLYDVAEDLDAANAALEDVTRQRAASAAYGGSAPFEETAFWDHVVGLRVRRVLRLQCEVMAAVLALHGLRVQPTDHRDMSGQLYEQTPGECDTAAVSFAAGLPDRVFVAARADGADQLELIDVRCDRFIATNEGSGDTHRRARRDDPSEN